METSKNSTILSSGVWKVNGLMSLIYFAYRWADDTKLHSHFPFTLYGRHWPPIRCFFTAKSVYIIHIIMVMKPFCLQALSCKKVAKLPNTISTEHHIVHFPVSQSSIIHYWYCVLVTGELTGCQIMHFFLMVLRLLFSSLSCWMNCSIYEHDYKLIWSDFEVLSSFERWLQSENIFCQWTQCQPALLIYSKNWTNSL